MLIMAERVKGICIELPVLPGDVFCIIARLHITARAEYLGLNKTHERIQLLGRLRVVGNPYWYADNGDISLERDFEMLYGRYILVQKYIAELSPNIKKSFIESRGGGKCSCITCRATFVWKNFVGQSEDMIIIIGDVVRVIRNVDYMLKKLRECSSRDIV